MKPQLANDADLDTMQYPCWFQPKIDGVRGGQYSPGKFTGRSLDAFKGFGVTKFFSNIEFANLDGEITLGASPTSEGLCRLTSGALKAFDGVTQMADFHWHLFDYVNDDLKSLKYQDRYLLLCDRLIVLRSQGLAERLHMVPFTVVNSREEADAAVAKALNEGYEGGIFRNHQLAAKEGRPGKKEQQLVRVKPWITSEIMIEGVRQGEKNTNTAKTNSLGRTERSSAKGGMVPNGEVGSVYGRFIADVYHPFIPGKLLFAAGAPAEVGAGELTTKEAKHYWEHQDEIVGHIGTIKHLAHDVHEKVRMGTFVAVRLPQDMS